MSGSPENVVSNSLSTPQLRDSTRLLFSILEWLPSEAKAGERLAKCLIRDGLFETLAHLTQD